ncbi:tail fiber domain-containing protein [Vibrio amylolyticus]|uniref:tail fiber domain-containing protein n=1 Tax=Vibrio amylolyticus TaxID=2847292 RepID=UPI00355424C8
MFKKLWAHIKWAVEDAALHAYGAKTAPHFLSIGGGSSSGTSGGSASGSGGSWILDAIGDDVAGIMGGMMGNIGNIPDFTTPDYGQAQDAISGLGDFYKSQITTDLDPNKVQGIVDANQQMLGQSFAGIDTAATGGGNMGSSRAGLAQGSAAAGASQQLNQDLAQYQQQVIDNAMGAANSMGGLIDQGLGIAGDASRAEFLTNLQQSNPEFFQLLLLQAGVGGMAGWGGSASGDWSSSSDSKSRGWSLSDKNGKENIIKIGELSNGLNLYVFSYTEEAQEKLGVPSGIQSGVMAQEVLEVLPEAVTEHESGFYLVDYLLVLGNCLPNPKEVV